MMCGVARRKWSLLLGVSTLSVCPLRVGFAARPPAFPEADPKLANKGLLFQLALSRTELVFGEKLQVYVRFVNVGETGLWMWIRERWSPGQSPVCFRLSGKWGRYFFLDGRCDVARLMYLAPGQAVICRLADRLPAPGVHALSVTYLYKPDGAIKTAEDIWTGEVSSNEITITVADELLSGPARAAFENELISMLEHLRAGDEMHMPAALAASAPYSLPTLRRAFQDGASGLAADALWQMGPPKDTALLPDILHAVENQMAYLERGPDRPLDKPLRSVMRLLPFFAEMMSPEEAEEVAAVLRKGVALESEDAFREFCRLYLMLFPEEAVPVVHRELEARDGLLSIPAWQAVEQDLLQAQLKLQEGE